MISISHQLTKQFQRNSLLIGKNQSDPFLGQNFVLEFGYCTILNLMKLKATFVLFTFCLILTLFEKNVFENSSFVRFVLIIQFNTVLSAAIKNWCAVCI